MTTDPVPDSRSKLHPRLTVARGAGRGRDLEGVLIEGADLISVAEEVASERSAERVAVRARLDAAVARSLHDLEVANARRDELRAERQSLLDGAEWAIATCAERATYEEAIERARVLFEARRPDQRAARAALDRVLEQRSAAAIAMQDADSQVADLDGFGMDETGLRRELESAGEAARLAHEAHAAVVTGVQRLLAERDAAERRAVQLREELAATNPVVPRDDQAMGRVDAALLAWTQAADSAGADNYSLALADAFTDLLADLDQQESVTGPSPDDETLQAAQRELERSTGELRRIEAGGAPTITPQERAQIDVAHSEVDAAAHRADRKLGRGAALRRLEQAQAVERELLDRLGFGTYLDVVLSGGRTNAPNPERATAESTFLAARGAVERMQRARQGSPELDHLHSERARLLAHVVDRLGVDPGSAVIALLRAHPMLPGHVVVDLREALHSVGLHPVGVSLSDAAEAWLREQIDGQAAEETHRTARAQLEGELAELIERGTSLTTQLAEARQAEANAVEQLELATRSVGAVEAELTDRAGGDATRFQRFIAAQQLRTQVEALTATLTHAEHEARLRLSAATEAVQDAEVALDRAQGALEGVVRKARTLAEFVPPSDRPTGDRLTTLLALAEALRTRAAQHQPSIDESAAHVATVNAQVDAAVAVAREAGTAFDGPRPEDVRDGLERLLSRQTAQVVLDEPFGDADAALLDDLLALVRSHAGGGPVVLLTDDPRVLGWAIELPADQGAVVSTDSVLNLCARNADTERAGGSTEVIRSTTPSPGSAPTTATPPAHQNAGS